MAEKFVVGYDGSSASRRALDFAVARAKAQGGSVLIAHVLEWSPYSFLTPEELEERHGRRKQELERAQTALLDPVMRQLEDSGVEISTELKYGHIADTVCEIARKHDATQIVIGRDGHGGLAARVFGSVAGSLVQMSPMPCTIVP